MMTICIILKNDEKYISNLLNNINEKFNNIDYEVIIVDMASNDRTKEISSTFTEKIYDYDGDNVIEAKKLAVSYSQSENILFLEPDDIINTVDETKLIEILNSDSNIIGTIECVNHNIVGRIDTSYNVSEERYFNKERFHYSKNSESLIPDKDINIQKVDIGIVVNKMSYIYETDEEKRNIKRNKKFNELEKRIEINPEEPYNFFLLGMAYKMEDDNEMARAYLLRALELPINPNAAYIQLAVVVYGNILLDLELYEEALMLENVYDLFDGIADFLCLMGQIYLRTGFIAEAIREFTKATNTLGCIEKPSRSIVPNYNLGCIYEMMGDIEIARKLYLRCGDYKRAQERLAQLD